MYSVIQSFHAAGVQARALAALSSQGPPTRGLDETQLKGWSHTCYSTAAGTGQERLFVLPGGDSGQGKWFSGDPGTLDKHLQDHLISLGSRVLVSGGHYVPDLREFTKAPARSLAGLVEAARIARELHRRGQSFGFLIPINDILMSGEQRALFYENFVPPDVFRSTLEDLERETGHFDVFLVSESKLAERLNKEKSQLARVGKLSKTADGEYRVLLRGEPITLVAHGQPMAAKCIRGYARLVGLPAALGYSGYVQVLPRCATNAHLGFEIGCTLYSGVPALLLYRTITCW